MEAKG
jgi:hypothetical protein